MTRKSVVAVVMSALMILSTSLPAYADTVVAEQGESGIELFGTPDYNAPVLESTSVDKTEVAAGESFIITLNVSDDLSGFDFAHISIKNESTGKYLSISDVDYKINDLGGLKYSVECVVQVPIDETVGTLILNNVMLYDNNGII